jgi:hypothetical protein
MAVERRITPVIIAKCEHFSEALRATASCLILYAEDEMGGALAELACRRAHVCNADLQLELRVTGGLGPAAMFRTIAAFLDTVAEGPRPRVVPCSRSDSFRAALRARELPRSTGQCNPVALAGEPTRIRNVTKLDALPAPVRLSEDGLVIEGVHFSLTRLESKFLRALAEAAGNAVARAELLRRVWALDRDPETFVVEQLVARLRKKHAPLRARIQNVRGVGYRFRL